MGQYELEVGVGQKEWDSRSGTEGVLPISIPFEFGVMALLDEMYACALCPDVLDARTYMHAHAHDTCSCSHVVFLR